MRITQTIERIGITKDSLASCESDLACTTHPHHQSQIAGHNHRSTKHIPTHHTPQAQIHKQHISSFSPVTITHMTVERRGQIPTGGFSGSGTSPGSRERETDCDVREERPQAKTLVAPEAGTTKCRWLAALLVCAFVRRGLDSEAFGGDGQSRSGRRYAPRDQAESSGIKLRCSLGSLPMAMASITPFRLTWSMVVVVLIRLSSMRVRVSLLLVGLVARVRPRIACASVLCFAASVVLCPAAHPPHLPSQLLVFYSRW